VPFQEILDGLGDTTQWITSIYNGCGFAGLKKLMVWYVAIYPENLSLATAEALFGPDFRTVRYQFKLLACPDPSCGKSFETGFDVPWWPCLFVFFF